MQVKHNTSDILVCIYFHQSSAGCRESPPPPAFSLYGTLRRRCRERACSRGLLLRKESLRTDASRLPSSGRRSRPGRICRRLAASSRAFFTPAPSTLACTWAGSCLASRLVSRRFSCTHASSDSATQSGTTQCPKTPPAAYSQAPDGSRRKPMNRTDTCRVDRT